MAFRVLGLLIFSFSSLTFGAVVGVPLQEGDRILLTGANAQVIVTATGGPRQLTLKGATEGGWSWQRQGSVIEIQGPVADSRRGLQDQLKNPGPRAQIEISGPSIPTEIHLRDGIVNLMQGSQEARVHLRNGRIVSMGRSGSLKASLNKGEISVNDGSGALDLDIYQGNVVLKNLQVEGDVQVFGGQISIDQSRGRLSLTSSNAVTRIQKFTGTLQMENGKGIFTGTDLQGRVEGTSAEGAVNLKIIGETEVHLKTQAARVQVNLPAASGALLNLATAEGDLLVPSELKVVRTASEKSVKGRVKGETGKVSVTVRSQEGSIVVK